MKFRPLSGSSVTCFSLITCPIEAVAESMAVAFAVTSTVSERLPADSWRSIRCTWSTFN